MSKSAFILWHYSPSLPAAIAFAAAFGLLTALHLVLRITRGTKMHNPVIVGGVFEIIGYGARAAAHYSRKSTIVYAIQSLFLLLAPILFAASVYMFLGRIIRSSNRESLAVVPVRWVTRSFVGGDVACFIVQAAGGGILSAAKSQSTIDVGNYVILTGIGLQIVVFIVFMVVAALFHVRLSRDQDDNISRITRQLGLLYVTSTLITARNVYRVLEYGFGQSGYLISHEWSLYTFDAGLMTLVMLVIAAWYFTTDNSNKREQNQTQLEK